jgi:hypothetical protein
MGRPPKKLDFFVNKDGCFVCTSHHNDKCGYPVKRYCGGQYHISRIIWQECFGVIPKTMYVLHKCDNPNCINPEHLFIGTQLDNMRDCAAKGRTNNGQAKLTENQIKKIRNESGTIRYLGKKYKVSSTAISNIKNRISWRYIV